MYIYDYYNKLVKFDVTKYHTNYDKYYAYYKIKYNITIPKTNIITEENILDYLNNNKNLFSL